MAQACVTLMEDLKECGMKGKEWSYLRLNYHGPKTKNLPSELRRLANLEAYVLATNTPEDT